METSRITSRIMGGLHHEGGFEKPVT